MLLYFLLPVWVNKSLFSSKTSSNSLGKLKIRLPIHNKWLTSNCIAWIYPMYSRGRPLLILNPETQWWNSIYHDTADRWVYTKCRWVGITRAREGFMFRYHGFENWIIGGVYIRSEKEIDRELLNLACRLHISEIMLEKVFNLNDVSKSPNLEIFHSIRGASRDTARWRGRLPWIH